MEYFLNFEFHELIFEVSNQENVHLFTCIQQVN